MTAVPIIEHGATVDMETEELGGDHRITEWFGLEGTLRSSSSNPPAIGRNTSPNDSSLPVLPADASALYLILPWSIN